MANYKIEWKRSAIKELRSIQKEYIRKIIKSVNNLDSNPYPIGNRKLSGSERTYRIRIGIYRIIYEIEEEILIIQIIRVRHRKNVYKE